MCLHVCVCLHACNSVYMGVWKSVCVYACPYHTQTLHKIYILCMALSIYALTSGHSITHNIIHNVLSPFIIPTIAMVASSEHTPHLTL